MKVDWEASAHRFTKNNSAETIDLLEAFLLAKPTTQTNRELILSTAGSSSEPEFIRKAFIGFMSLPEYQLC